jgi:hypothetical protein
MPMAAYTWAHSAVAALQGAEDGPSGVPSAVGRGRSDDMLSHIFASNQTDRQPAQHNMRSRP